ncbi:MAG: hypothetical protein IPL25_13075 [Saprospiraceae bacterium]|nr:hypothetical protein [Candidatus Vicinibacter affinis]
MLRKIMVISFLLAIFSCHPARGTFVISQIKQSDHTIIGAIEVNHLPKKQSCEQAVKSRIIDKFLNEGFENTSYWRPRTFNSVKLTPEIRTRIYENVYVTEDGITKKGSVKKCYCKFQFNLNSSLQILENEGIMHAFGY